MISTDKADMLPVMHREAQASYRGVAQVLGTSLSRAWRCVNGLGHFSSEERAVLVCYYLKLIGERMGRLAAVLDR